jgi:hypothetical protein
MTEKLLQLTSLEPAKTYLKSAHDIYCLRSAAKSLRQGNMSSLVNALLRGMRFNPRFPLFAIKKILVT